MLGARAAVLSAGAGHALQSLISSSDRAALSWHPHLALRLQETATQPFLEAWAAVTV